MDRAHSAECLGAVCNNTHRNLSYCSAMNKPEQSKAIREVVYAKKISHWKILFISFCHIYFTADYNDMPVLWNYDMEKLYIPVWSLCSGNSYKSDGIR